MAEKKNSRTPPPIRVTPNPFGDFTEEQIRPGPTRKDKFYLDGYSEKRFEREVALRAGEKVAPLTHRFQYVSDTNTLGGPSKEKYVEWLGKGYRPVQFDELASLGIDPAKSTCERGVNGEARVASQILMVCDAPTAAYHYQQNQELIASQFKVNVEDRLEAAVDDYNAKHGRTNKTGTRAEVKTEVKNSTFELE